MSSDTDSEVSVFWDYTSCPLPSTTNAGYAAVNNIRTISQQFGSVKSFRMYMKSSSQQRTSRTTLSELQCSGVSVIDCPEIDGYSMGDGMMLVDLIAHAVDNSASSTLVLISGDRVLAYALSILRLRCYRVVVIAPDAAHPSILAHASLSFSWGLDVLYPSGSSTTPPKYPGGMNPKGRWRFGGFPTADGDDLNPSNFNLPRRSGQVHVNGLADSGSDQSDTQEYGVRTSRATLKPRNLPETFSSPLLSKEAPLSQTPSIRIPPTRTFATRAVSTDPIPVSPPKVYESRAVSPVRHPDQVRVTRATSPIPQQAPEHPVTSLPQSPLAQYISQEQTEPSPPSEPKRTYATRAVSTDPVLVSPLKVYESRATSPLCLQPAQLQATSAELPIDEVLDHPITRLPKLPPIQDLPLEDSEPPLVNPPALVVDQPEPPSYAKSPQAAFPPSLLPPEPPAAVESNSKVVEVPEESITDTQPSPLNRKVECVDEPPSPPFRYPSISNTFIPGPNPIPKSLVAPKHPPPDPRPSLERLQLNRTVERLDEQPLPSFRYPSISETFIPDPNPIPKSPVAPRQGPSLETLQRLRSLGKGSASSLHSPGLKPSGAEFVPRGMTWTFPSPNAPPMEREGPPTLGVLRPLPLGIQQPPSMGMQFGDDFLEPLKPPNHYSTPPATNMGHLPPGQLGSGSLVNPPNHIQGTAPVSQGTYQGSTPKAPPLTHLLPLKPPIPPAARVAPGPPSVIPPAFRPLARALHKFRSQNITRPLQSTVSAKLGGKPTYQLAGVLKFSHYLAIAKEQGLVETGGSTPREWVALHPRWVDVPCN